MTHPLLCFLVVQNTKQDQVWCLHAEQLPPGFPPDLPAPESLSLADAKDAEAMIEILGEYTVRALYSKTWQLREAALMSIEKVLQGQGGGLEGARKGELFKALSRALLRSVLDKVANVFHGTLQVSLHNLTSVGLPEAFLLG